MIGKQIAKKLLDSKLAKATGVSLVNYDLLKYMKHYLWIAHHKSIPTYKIFFNSPKEVTEEDILLCRRIISAYQAAVHECAPHKNNTSVLWSESLKKHCRHLMGLLDSENAQSLAKAMAGMFRETFVYGLASGHLVENAKSPLGAKIWSMKYQDNIVALAEYLGVVRNESTQQGAKAYGLKDGMDALVSKIEGVVGVPVGFPDIGSPYGIKANNSLMTMEHPEHLYVALRVSQAVQDHLREKAAKALNVVEIGAGFGGLAYWMMVLRRINIAAYTIIDLPLINAIQAYFLAKAFGASQIRLFGEKGNEAATIAILPASSYQKKVTNPIDILINENSMPEMSDDIVENYIKFAKKQVSGIFFSYNHEAYSVVYGRPQVFVPGVVERVGGFSRISRNASWLRSGYVEEVYARQSEEHK